MKRAGSFSSLALRCLIPLTSCMLSYVTTFGKNNAPYHGLGSEIERALEHLSLPETPSAWEMTPDRATRGAVTRIQELQPGRAGRVRDNSHPMWTHHDGPRRQAVSCR